MAAGGGEPEAVVSLCEAGALPPAIALMRLAAAAPSAAALERLLQGIGGEQGEALRRLAARQPGAWATVQGILAAAGGAPQADGPAAVAHWAAAFDRAVSISPEASVALFSFGDAERLRLGTAEIAAFLRGRGVLGRDRRLLDLGCGIGRIEEALAGSVAEMVGLDISPVMLAEARRRCAALANVSFRQGSGLGLPGFAADSFDAVLAVDSMPYLVDAGEAAVARHFADIARLLRAGGDFVILNYAYRGDFREHSASVSRLARAHGFRLAFRAARAFRHWDGTAFHLVRAVSGRMPRGRRD